MGAEKGPNNQEDQLNAVREQLKKPQQQVEQALQQMRNASPEQAAQIAKDILKMLEHIKKQLLEAGLESLYQEMFGAYEAEIMELLGSLEG